MELRTWIHDARHLGEGHHVLQVEDLHLVDLRHVQHQVLLQVEDLHRLAHQVRDRLLAAVHRVHTVVLNEVIDQHLIALARIVHEVEDPIAPVHRVLSIEEKVRYHLEPLWDVH